MTDGSVTVEMLKKATMRADGFLDCQDYYCHAFTCVEYPELTKDHTGPRGRSKHLPRITIRVNGIEVPRDLQAIADAINAYRGQRQ